MEQTLSWAKNLHFKCLLDCDCKMEIEAAYFCNPDLVLKLKELISAELWLY